MWGVPPSAARLRPPLTPLVVSLKRGRRSGAREGQAGASLASVRGAAGGSRGHRCEPRRSAAAAAAGPGWCGGGSERIAEPLSPFRCVAAAPLAARSSGEPRRIGVRGWGCDGLRADGVGWWWWRGLGLGLRADGLAWWWAGPTGQQRQRARVTHNLYAVEAAAMQPTPHHHGRRGRAQ